MNILVKNANIITIDECKPYIKNGYLGTNDRKIEFVGDSIKEGFTWDYEIDAKGGTLIPGLCNAHSHTAMTLLRSYAEGYNLQDWLFKKIFPIEDNLTGADVYTGTMLGIAEMIRTGTTLVNDTYFFMEDAVKAYVEIGLNVNVSRSVQCFEEKDDYTDDYRVAEAVSLYREFNGYENNRIIVEMYPHAVYTCNDGYLKYIAEVAKKNNMHISSHLSENETEHLECIKKYNKTPTELYYDAGLLDNGINGAHCVWLSDNDLEIFKQTKSFITHNPSSNLKLGSGIANILKYREYGITVALGTDGCASNNNLNMFEEMHIASLLMSGSSRKPELVKPLEILKMATLNGALAMRRNNKGIIKEGYDADFVIIDTNEPYYYPHHNDINNLIYTAQGTDVCVTVTNGKVLYENKEYKTLDIEKVKFDAVKSKERLFINK